MLLRGIINIQGLSLSATVTVDGPKIKGVSFCPHIGEQGKWRAYHNVSGQTRHLGYYDTREQAIEAARQKRNLTGRTVPERNGVYPVKRGGATVWRATFTPPIGRRLQLGEYAMKGAAILVRDVVARRSGAIAAVPDYEMPLAYVTNVIARSFLRDRIPAATGADLDEYERRVAELSGIERTPVAPPPLTLPDEVWRQKQPSRKGRSSFDTIEE